MTKATKQLYFLGIGGIGMSALARYFHHLGYQISGYDLTSSPLTKALENEGMSIHYQVDTDKIPQNPEMVIYTPAIPKDHPEFIFCQQNNFPLIKRAALLGKISQQYYTVAVAGTHGKTSISAIVAHLLKNAGQQISAFIGGITKNYRSNLILSDSTEVFVVEADEFDRSFLLLQPNIGIISSMDADHLDIYDNHDSLNKAFIDFSHQINSSGWLIYHISLAPHFKGTGKRLSYGIDPKADLKATHVHINNHHFVFDIEHKEGSIKKIALQVPGLHYIENALAATGVALELGLTAEEIKDGLMSFKGVERRFDIRIDNDKLVYIDDYAHHPEEIRVTIEAVKMLYPNKRVLGIFQPHLYSRTRDFATEFAQSLDSLDTVALMPIYPAREKPLAGITSHTILDLMNLEDTFLVEKSELLQFIQEQSFDILLTMGAGDIGQMVSAIEQKLLSC